MDATSNSSDRSSEKGEEERNDEQQDCPKASIGAEKVQGKKRKRYVRITHRDRKLY
jgi:hypothetical protein